MNQWLRFYRWEAKTNRTLFSYSWFFPLLRKWQVIARNSDWFVTLFAPVVIGRSVYLVVVFRQWVSEWVSECNNRALNRNSADFRSDVPRSLKLPVGRHFSPFLLSSRGPDWYLIFSSHYMRSASGNLTVACQDVLTQGTYEIAFSRGVLYRCVFSELPVFSIFFSALLGLRVWRPCARRGCLRVH